MSFFFGGGCKDGLNWYVYCRNNPLCFVDPTGFGDRNVAGVKNDLHLTDPKYNTPEGILLYSRTHIISDKNAFSVMDDVGIINQKANPLKTILLAGTGIGVPILFAKLGILGYSAIVNASIVGIPLLDDQSRERSSSVAKFVSDKLNNMKVNRDTSQGLDVRFTYKTIAVKNIEDMDRGLNGCVDVMTFEIMKGKKVIYNQDLYAQRQILETIAKVDPGKSRGNVTPLQSYGAPEK